MGVQGNIDLHFWITRGIARRMGVNLSEAMHDGFLTQADFAEMITRCRGCDKSEGCIAVLSERAGAAVSVPDWCRNAGVLSELSALH